MILWCILKSRSFASPPQRTKSAFAGDPVLHPTDEDLSAGIRFTQDDNFYGIWFSAVDRVETFCLEVLDDLGVPEDWGGEQEGVDTVENASVAGKEGTGVFDAS